MNELILDTNVWLDYHLSPRPAHADAVALVKGCIECDIPLLIAAHSLKDFWYLLWQAGKSLNISDRELSPETASRLAKEVAWAATAQIADLATVVGSDASDTWLALKMRQSHDDYEDNLVVAAALRSDARLLVTSDQDLIAHCPVAAATPKDALTFLDL